MADGLPRRRRSDNGVYVSNEQIYDEVRKLRDEVRALQIKFYGILAGLAAAVYLIVAKGGM